MIHPSRPRHSGRRERQEVVERAREVKDDQAQAEDAEGHHLVRPARARGPRYEHGYSHAGQLRDLRRAAAVRRRHARVAVIYSPSEGLSGRNHKETWAGCIVSFTTPTSSLFNASRVFLASYFLR